PLRGPRTMPILGKRWNKILFYRDPIAYHQHVYNTYGTLAAFVQGGTKILIYAPEYNRQVMSQTDVFQADRIAPPGPPGSALDYLGMGLNTMNGAQHRHRRQLLMPAFHKRQLEVYCEEMIAATQPILDRWQIGQVHNMAAEMRQITLTSTCQVLFAI